MGAIKMVPNRSGMSFIPAYISHDAQITHYKNTSNYVTYNKDPTVICQHQFFFLLRIVKIMSIP